MSDYLTPVGVAMRTKRWLFLSGVVGVVCTSLAACVSSSIPDGISGVLSAANVERSSKNLHLVLNALKSDAAMDGAETTTWYETAVAGFNFVDTQCVDYFNELYRLERRRNAVKSALASFSQTSSAILAVTHASTISVAVVAQAFGLAQQITDIVGGSLLYRLPPDQVLDFVDKLQSAYRIGAAQKRFDINSPTEAYYEIQSYLKLCLPPMVEARLVSFLAAAKAVPVTADGATKIVVGSDLSAEEKARAAAVEPLGTPDQRLKPPYTPPPALGALNDFEARMSPSQLRKIQELLCVDVTGSWVLPPNTREAFVAFYKGLGQDRSYILKNGVMGADMIKIREAMSLYTSCKKDGYTNAEHLGTLM